MGLTDEDIEERKSVEGKAEESTKTTEIPLN